MIKPRNYTHPFRFCCYGQQPPAICVGRLVVVLAAVTSFWIGAGLVPLDALGVGIGPVLGVGIGLWHVLGIGLWNVLGIGLWHVLGIGLWHVLGIGP